MVFQNFSNSCMFTVFSAFEKKMVKFSVKIPTA